MCRGARRIQINRLMGKFRRREFLNQSVGYRLEDVRESRQRRCCVSDTNGQFGFFPIVDDTSRIIQRITPPTDQFFSWDAEDLNSLKRNKIINHVSLKDPIEF